jgi:preprotein translocase, SecE subunit, bacterial
MSEKSTKKDSSEKTKIRVLKEDDSKKKSLTRAERKDLKKSAKLDKKSKNGEKAKRNMPKPLRILLTPLFPIGRYFRDSWRELRQVRWTNRKATWKMTLAVIAYTIFFFLFIMLLDMLFTFVFNKVLA